MMRRLIKGYTLIEILIVLFIISIVASVALLSIGRNRNKQLETITAELTQIISLAEERAMLQPATLGLFINNRSLEFKVLSTNNEGKKKWLSLEDKWLSARTYPNDIEFNVNSSTKQDDDSKEEDSSDPKANNSPQIIISTNGDTTPFTLYISRRGEKPRYAIFGSGDGNVNSKSLY